MTDTAQQSSARARRWRIGLGILALVLGCIGLFMTPALTIAGVIWYGVLFAVLGIALIVETATSAQRPWPWVNFLLGALYLVAGYLIAFNPLSAAVGLTMLIGMLLIAIGIARLVWAFRLPSGARGIGVASGVFSAILGVMIVMQWPASSFWVIGLFIAVDLISHGVTAIVTGLGERRLSRA